MKDDSYTSLEPTTLSGLGVAAPSFNGTSASFFATTSFIYSFFFIAIVMAAFWGYTLAGIWRMQASQESITKSNEKFKKVTLGLLGSFGLILLILTVNKDLLTGDIGLGELKAGRGANGAYVSPMSQSGRDVATPAAIPLGVGSGVLGSEIYKAAMSAKDTLSTANAAGTNGGRLACAYAVNVVLKNAGVAPIDRTGNLSVASMEKGLQNGRGTLINQSNTFPGDIVIEAGTGHVGICLNTGCSQVISNSSSKALFSWVSGPNFLPSYKNGMGRFYRVNN